MVRRRGAGKAARLLCAAALVVAPTAPAFAQQAAPPDPGELDPAAPLDPLLDTLTAALVAPAPPPGVPRPEPS